MVDILSIVMVIIGALIGAGFASGQEIYTFFYKNGASGIIGIIISSVIISYIIYKTFIIIKQNNTQNYKEFLISTLNYNTSKKIEIINKVIQILILITFIIMVAGFGAFFEQEYRINSIIGSTILALLCFLVFITNVDGFIKINKYIVPLLVIFISIIGILNIPNIDINFDEVKNKEILLSIVSAIIYAGYNTILLIPVLIALNKKVKRRKIKYISIISGIIIAILAMIIYFLLGNIKINIKSIEMPAVYVITNNFSYFKNIYAFIILVSIFTTAISLGISFLENVQNHEKRYTQIACIMCITSVIFSQIGFSNLINLLYPIFGILGIIQICIILIKKTN